jgi:hypothetical protein
MANQSERDIIWQVPRSAASNRTSFDPYREFNTSPPTSHGRRPSNAPLLPNRRQQEPEPKQPESDESQDESKGFIPRAVRSLSARGNNRPNTLTLPSYNSSQKTGSYKLDEFGTPNSFKLADHKGPYTGYSTATEDNFVNTPSATLLPGGHPQPARQHPFFSNFEPPPWWPLLIHLGLCIVAYPILLFFVFITSDRSLFWTRFIVGAGCGLTGYALGASLIHLGKNILEAAGPYTCFCLSSCALVSRSGSRGRHPGVALFICSEPMHCFFPRSEFLIGSGHVLMFRIDCVQFGRLSSINRRATSLLGYG